MLEVRLGALSRYCIDDEFHRKHTRIIKANAFLAKHAGPSHSRRLVVKID